MTASVNIDYIMRFDTGYNTGCPSYTYTVTETYCAYCGVSSYSFDTVTGCFSYFTSDGLLCGLTNTYTLTVKDSGTTVYSIVITVNINGLKCSLNSFTSIALPSD